jgi:two-component system, cell cycle sensor histidine kinase and response regulator CckA
MPYHITRALRIAFVAMMSALVFETTKQTISSHIRIWGSPSHTILFITITTFAVTILVLRREARAEDALSEGEQLLQSVLHSGLDGFYLVDMRGRFLQVNDAYCAMSRYTREELLRMCVADVEGSETEEEVAAHIQHVIRKGMDRFESRHRRKDGQILDIETSVNFQNYRGGRLFCFLRDITERKRAEEALRESEEHFRQVVEGAPVGMYIQTDRGFRYFNPAALAMFGAESASQLEGKGYLEIIHPDSRAAVTERARIVREEKKAVPFLEERLLRVDGTVFDGEATAVPLIFEGRDGALVFVRDITERKREEVERRALEHQLRQAQKMEAVGRLAGGIAHDFNNLLMVIQSYTEMLQESLPAHDDSRKNTEQVLKAAHRAASLTRQMLAFSRKQITSPVMLDLNAVIDETTKMLKRLIGEDIEVRVDPAESLWTISADPDQIVQVLMNLCVNSRDAMPLGGILTIATGNITVDEGSIDGHPYITPGEYVRLSVTDTGTGICKEEQEQIFDPFFTTKEVSKGTGLGLAMVYGTVKQAGGYVWVDSERGQGACFTICLPRAMGVVASDTSAKTDAQPRGTETLLVTEDEEALREAICGYLRSLGYTVLEASSGQQALSLANEYDGHIELLISDVVMPKMSGRELSQMLGSLRPDLKTIHMSGYTDDAVLRHGVHDMGATFLQKPFNLSTLARKVRDTLGQTEPVQ